MCADLRKAQERPEFLRHRHAARRGALLITLTYLVIGCLWIAFSDRLARTLFPDPATYHLVQTIKGWVYVVLTAASLHRLICIQVDRITYVLEQRDVFAAMASHELRTPLTALSLQLDLIRRDLRALGDTQPGLAKRILKYADAGERQVARIKRLIDDLLDVHSIRSGKGLHFRTAAIDLAETVHQSIEDAAPTLQAFGCTVIQKITPGIWIHGDSERITQVVLNLINNAAKFGAGRPIEVLLEKQQRQGQDYGRILISDQGIGIRPEDRTKLFKPFERASSAQSFGGMGLGLFISSQIVLSHQGRITILDPQPGTTLTEPTRGTQVEVLLPIRSEHMEVPENHGKAA